MATASGDSLELLRQLSRPSSDNTDTMNFSEELELLQNVYFDDLTLNDEDTCSSDKKYDLLFHITPSTGDDKEKQYVYCDVEFRIDNQYPSLRPCITIKQSRGLSDAHTVSIMDGLLYLSKANLGSPMIYDLVEYVRDSLTHNNKPCGRCAICQWDFQDDDEFLRTECYHYFHPSCLTRYIVLHQEKITAIANEQDTHHYHHCKQGPSQELECPICRVIIKSNDSCLVNLQYMDYTNTSQEDNEPVYLDSKLLLWQQEMAVLYKKQLDQGGIIDLSAQDATIDENWVSSSSIVDTSPQDDGVIKEDKKETAGQEEKNESKKDKKWTQNHTTGYSRGQRQKNEGRKWKLKRKPWNEREWNQPRDYHSKSHHLYYKEDFTREHDDRNDTRVRQRCKNWKPRYEGQRRYDRTTNDTKTENQILGSHKSEATTSDEETVQKNKAQDSDVIKQNLTQMIGQDDLLQKGHILEKSLNKSHQIEDSIKIYLKRQPKDDTRQTVVKEVEGQRQYETSLNSGHKKIRTKKSHYCARTDNSLWDYSKEEELSCGNRVKSELVSDVKQEKESPPNTHRKQDKMRQEDKRGYYDDVI